MKIVVLGPPASGRNKIGRELAKMLGLGFVSSGDMLMGLSKADPSVYAYIRKGDMVPDGYVSGVVLKELAGMADFLLVGYPYDIGQAEDLDRVGRLDAVVHFQISEDLIMRRVADRVVCAKCFVSFNLSADRPKTGGVCDLCGGMLTRREDDTAESVSMKLHFYNKESPLIIERYRRAGVPIVPYTVEEGMSPSQNASKIVEALESRKIA